MTARNVGSRLEKSPRLRVGGGPAERSVMTALGPGEPRADERGIRRPHDDREHGVAAAGDRVTGQRERVRYVDAAHASTSRA